MSDDNFAMPQGILNMIDYYKELKKKIYGNLESIML